MVANTKRSAKKPASKTAKGLDPIPSGFHTVTPYLVIDGAARALEFYKKAFGAKELDRQPMPDGKLLHARMKIGDSIVMMSDEFPGSGTKAPSSVGTSTVTLHIYAKDIDKLWERALSAGAKTAMPLEDTFWGERYGAVVDPFGHRWSMSQQIKMSPQEMEEKRQKAMAMFAQAEHSGRMEEQIPT